MTVTDALLDSWDRQCRIVNAIAGLVTEDNRRIRPSSDGWALDKQLAHMHLVRIDWMSQFAPERAREIPTSFVDGWQTPSGDLDTIKSLLLESGVAVREAVSAALERGVEKTGPYDNPVLYLQHMIWHEGWHVGLIFLALRLAGQEPAESWEEANVWGEWRTEE